MLLLGRGGGTGLWTPQYRVQLLVRYEGHLNSVGLLAEVSLSSDFGGPDPGESSPEDEIRLPSQ
jgi:hypothetical protein